MLFESLSEKLQDAFKKLRGKGRLTEKDVKDVMREVRLALLEADVNFRIVKSFIQTVTEKAIGGSVLESVTPGQQVIKIVHDEMVNLLGASHSNLTFSSKPPTVFMMVGLNGAGKTTTTGKLGVHLRKQGKKPLFAACDVYRPAAVKQLQILGNSVDIPVFEAGIDLSPEVIAKKAIDFAVDNHYDTVILDTAGRFHINEELMEELLRIKRQIRPQEILLVVDAMTGQDAVTVADTFNQSLGIDGVILSKLDSDTRGGAALSVRSVTGKPIKFAALGEKMSDLEPFYPDRMASRILGMGDVLSLVEKAQQAFDEKEAVEMEKRLRSNDFDLDDFLNQLRQIKKMGSLKSILNMIPGLGQQVKIKDLDVDDSVVNHTEAIISSMTPKERRNPTILNNSRKRRVAKGSGRSVQEVNKLLKQFEDMKRMLRDIGGMGGKSAKGRGGGKFNVPFTGR
ncbi:MAG: signal recognition particle protein [Clostridiales bacterium]|jgi:signal recognition particle subunit SRP54|nr:signal recognition particle protein [Clostridiales bacterium]